MSYTLTSFHVLSDTDIQNLTATGIHDFGQVTIHGKCLGGDWGTAIRIWPSTYLFDCHSAHASDLIYIEKISPYPIWTPVKPNEILQFTLVFSGLPSTCVLFDLHEVIPEANGFYIPSVPRNELDVYYLDFS